MSLGEIDDMSSLWTSHDPPDSVDNTASSFSATLDQDIQRTPQPEPAFAHNARSENETDPQPNLTTAATASKSTDEGIAELYRLAERLNISVTISPNFGDAQSAIQIRAQLTTKNNGNTCFSFMYIPVEIRLKIYRLLLTNPILGTPASCPTAAKNGKLVKYDLSPAILRVSKQVYAEAVDVLYCENTFYYACVRVEEQQYGDFRDEYRDYEVVNYLSPLGRYCHTTCHIKQYGGLAKKTLSESPAPSKRVKHWNLVVSQHES